MAKTRLQKEETLKDLQDKFGGAKAVVFVNFDGLNVNDTREFRGLCRENNLDYVVAKKTLLKIALEKTNLNEVDLSSFERGIGTVFGSADEVAPAQTVAKFAKEHEAMTILGGIMLENPEGKRFLNMESVKALSLLPSKEQLLGKLVGSLMAPVSGLVNVLAGNTRNLVQVLHAIKESKA